MRFLLDGDIFGDYECPAEGDLSQFPFRLWTSTTSSNDRSQTGKKNEVEFIYIISSI